MKLTYRNRDEYMNNSFGSTPKLYVSKNFIKEYRVEIGRIVVKLGAWTKAFILRQDNRIPEHTISIPKQSIPYDIPDNLPYNIKIKNNVIHLGPIIAFIPKKLEKDLSIKKLETYHSRFKNYDIIGGLLFVCAGDSLNLENRSITGYYFNPDGKTESDRWKKGNFPFPDSIFKKIRISVAKEKAIKNVIGNRIFNTGSFNKLKLWEACSSHEKALKHLPFTKKCRSVEDLEEMLYKYESVYFKPISGSNGNGIVMAKKERNGILIINHKKEKKLFRTFSSTLEYLEQAILGKGYIAQQGIPTVYKNKKYDFRFYFQKDRKKQWSYQGSIGRVAQEGSIITNLKQVAHLSDGEKAIKIVFGVREKEAKRIINETIDVCEEICNILDRKLGLFGDIAIDIIIDQEHKPWILEINNLYGSKSLKVIKDTKTLKKLQTTPFEFAKALAGF